MEMRDHQNVAEDEGVESHHEVSALRNSLEQTLESLNGFIAYIRRCGGK